MDWDRLSEVQKAQLGEIAALIYLVASFLLLELEEHDLAEAFQPQKKQSVNERLLEDQLRTLESGLLLSGNILFSVIADARLREAIEAGSTLEQLSPLQKISTGWKLSILGGTLRVIGHLEEEELDVK